jgi:thiol-disulfide isomerase/thioredoxin
LPSFCITAKRSSADRLAVALLLLSALACSRPSAKKPPPAGADAISTASTAETAAPPAAPEPPTGVNDEANGPPPPDTTKGPPPPPASTELEAVGADRLLAEVRRLGGKGTLVNAWASWCGPCKHEIPMLQKLAAQFGPSGIHVLLVSLDEPADRDKATAFLRDHQIALTSYLAERPLGAFKQGMNPRWPGMLPASFLYDRTGSLRYFWGGEAFEDEVKPVLEALAAGKPIEGEANPAIAPEGEARER